MVDFAKHMKNKKTTPAPSKAIEPKKQALATRHAPPVINTEDDAGAGQEGMGRQDFMIPRLTILQSLSPQTKKSEPTYIKGSEEGMICDVLNSKVFDGEKGVLVIPASYRRANLEWKPDRGGFVNDHGNNDDILAQCEKNDRGQMVLKNKNLIAVTAEYFVMLIDEKTGEASPFVLSMAGVQLKKSRRWNTMMNQLRVPRADGSGDYNPAMFFRAYRLTTVPEKNDKGSWFGWNIAPDQNVLDMKKGQSLYLAARELRNSVKEGRVQATKPGEEHMGGGGHADEDASSPM